MTAICDKMTSASWAISDYTTAFPIELRRQGHEYDQVWNRRDKAVMNYVSTSSRTLQIE